MVTGRSANDQLEPVQPSYYVTNRNPQTIQMMNNDKTSFIQSLGKPFKICSLQIHYDSSYIVLRNQKHKLTKKVTTVMYLHDQSQNL